VAGALHAVVDPPPRVVIPAMAAEFQRRGVPLLTVSTAEGYIESHWFDAATLSRRPEPFGAEPGTVKVRVFADPVGRNTRVYLEAVVRIGWDPSAPPRDLERMVDSTHVVRPLLDAMIEGLGPRRDGGQGGQGGQDGQGDPPDSRGRP